MLLLIATSNAYADGYSDEYDAQAGLALINAQVAYDRGYTGAGIVVGVSDSGLAINHPEFKDRGFEFVRYFGGYTLPIGDIWGDLLNKYVFPIDDPSGHGSHVSGIIAASRDGVGMHGVAYDAKLVVAGIGDVSGWVNPSGDAFYPHLIMSGARIINNSWGSGSISDMTPENLTLEKLIVEVKELGINEVLKTGTLLVFATGNDNANQPSIQAVLPYYFPELTANWVAVNALTLDGKESSYGNECGVAKNWCISAPGGDVIDNFPTSVINNGVFSVNVPGSLDDSINALYHDFYPNVFPEAGGNYTRMSGTSMAAPHVSGALAVILQAFPYMKMEQIKLTMFTTATDIGAPGVDEIYGWGLLNLGKAIDGPGQFTKNWEVDTQGFSSVWNNDISGIGDLVKLGEGTLQLTGENTYTGDTHLNGGILAVSKETNLGRNGNPLQFNGGTLKFDANFDLTRNLEIGNSGGTLHINDFTKTQSSNISGSGQFGITGGGSYTLDRPNSQQGGLAVSGNSQVNVADDSFIGFAGSKVTLNNGRLDLLPGFITAASGQFNRPLEIGDGNSTIITEGQTFSYTGSVINGSGLLSFEGPAFTMGSNLSLNSGWNGDFTVPDGLILSGRGYILGSLLVNGILSPGNSPGTMTVVGSVTQSSGSSLNIDIDGTGIGNGAGNYDRLILTGAGSIYTADGSLNAILRGITAPATNTFTPALGQGFRIVSAEGGVTGSYATFTQPVTGLMSGTRMDLVYGSHALTLYATPSSYINLAAAGVQTNSTRQSIGGILETMRPDPGVRLSDSITKTLFDNLASQSAGNLPIAFDQLAGVGYAQLIGMNRENVRFIANQAMTIAGNQRRNHDWRNETLSDTDNSEVFNAGDTKVWGTAIALVSSWGGDRYGHGMHDTLGGLMGGVQKRIDEQTNAGYSVTYASSSPDMRDNMGSGAMQNLQLMGYASKTYDSGFYLQASAGAGGGQIDAKRYVSVLNNRYQHDIYTSNVSTAIMAGWSDVTAQNIRYETELGLSYLALHHFGFNDRGGDALNQLNVDGNTSHSLMGSIGANISLPFEANHVNWLTVISGSIHHELGDVRTEFDARMLDQTYEVKSGAIGRDRLNLGLSLTGQVARNTSITFNVSHQTAENWNATAAAFAIKTAF